MPWTRPDGSGKTGFKKDKIDKIDKIDKMEKKGRYR